jgi:hypothetical protein
MKLSYALCISGVIFSLYAPRLKAQSSKPTLPSAEIPKDPTKESSSLSSESSFGEDSFFRKKRMSVGVSFPEGGSLAAGSSAGIRYFVSDKYALSGYLLLSNSKPAKTTSFGLSAKFQGFLLAPTKRAAPYWFAQGAFGVNSGDGAKENDDPQFGIGGGGGVEVFFIKEFSAFADIGINMLIAPSDSFSFSTFTSRIGVNYNFEI